MSTLSTPPERITIARTPPFRVPGTALLLLFGVVGFAALVGYLATEYNILLVLGGILALAGLVLMFVEPDATTLIILFVTYSNLTVVAVRFHAVPEFLSVLFFFFLGIPLLNYVLFRRQRIILNRVLFMMLAYLGVLLASAVLSGQAEESDGRIVAYLTEGVALYFLILNTVRTPDLVRRSIWALILAGCFMGSISLYQELTHSYDNSLGGLAQVGESEISTGVIDPNTDADAGRLRLAGPIGSKNRYAQIMVVLLPLALFRVRAERSRILRVLAAAACIPILGGALLTFSRGAGLSIIITALAMVYLRTLKVRHFLAISLAGAVFVLLVIPDYVYRISTVAELGELVTGGANQTSGSVQGRATENLASLNIFLDHPILGVGPGQTNLYTAEYGNEIGLRLLQGTRRGHNMYLEELADTGLLGFVIFMGIVLYTMYELAQVRRRLAASRPDIAYTAAGFLLAIIAYLATAIFLHLSYIRYYWLLLALAGAAIQVCHAAVAAPGQEQT